MVLAISEKRITEELRRAQSERAAVERERADAAADEQESKQHRRRAEKAQYLRQKLEQRAESEREIDG
jgi:hypothetical protein